MGWIKSLLAIKPKITGNIIVFSVEPTKEAIKQRLSSSLNMRIVFYSYDKAKEKRTEIKSESYTKAKEKYYAKRFIQIKYEKPKFEVIKRPLDRFTIKRILQ